MEDKEFKHFFDAGLAWARKHIAAKDSLKDMRAVIMQDVKSADSTGFAAGALYGIAEAEAGDDCQQAR